MLKSLGSNSLSLAKFPLLAASDRMLHWLHLLQMEAACWCASTASWLVTVSFPIVSAANSSCYLGPSPGWSISSARHSQILPFRPWFHNSKGMRSFPGNTIIICCGLVVLVRFFFLRHPRHSFKASVLCLDTSPAMMDTKVLEKGMAQFSVSRSFLPIQILTKWSLSPSLNASMSCRTEANQSMVSVQVLFIVNPDTVNLLTSKYLTESNRFSTCGYLLYGRQWKPQTWQQEALGVQLGSRWGRRERKSGLQWGWGISLPNCLPFLSQWWLQSSPACSLEGKDSLCSETIVTIYRERFPYLYELIIV